MKDSNFLANVSIKYGELGDYIDWCEKNCTGQWSLDILTVAGNQPGTYLFKFNEQKDYTTFVVWKS